MSQTQAPLLRPSAFTLIELLIVISIIGLLIGILLPALGAARHTARLTADLAQMQQIKVGVVAYGADYDSYYPGSYFNSNPTNVGTEEQLVSYTSSFTWSYQDALGTQYMYTNSSPDMSLWRSPVDTLPTRFPGGQKRSYAFTGAEPKGISPNAWAARVQNGVVRRTAILPNGDVNPTATDQGYSRRFHDVLASSSTIDITPNFADLNFCGWANLDTTNSFETMGNSRSHQNGPWAANPNRFYGYGGAAAEAGDDPRDYYVNFSFADGHSAAVKAGETLNPAEPYSTVFSDGQGLWNAEKH